MASANFLWLSLFPLILLPLCALGGGAFTWWWTRDDEPDDMTLVRHFVVATITLLMASATIPRFDWFRNNFDPASRIGRTLQTDVVNVALQQHQPGDWRRLEAQARRDAQALLPQKEVLARVRTEQLRLVRHQIQFAPGSVVLDYRRALVPALKELQAIDPALCVGLAWPRANREFDVRGRLTPDVADGYARASAQLIASRADPAAAAAANTTAADAQKVQAAFRAIRDQLDAKHGGLVSKLSTPEVGKLPAGPACSATIALLERIVQEPAPIAGPMLRTLLRT